MQKKALIILCAPLFLDIFSLQSFGQIRIPRTISMRRYQPVVRIPMYVPMRMPIRVPPPIYYSCCQNTTNIINAQNVYINQNDRIREYPSSSARIPTSPVEYVYSRETPSYRRETGNSDSRIQNIENRLSNLESLASQIKTRLDNIPSQNALSNDYNQRLVRLEEQMAALRDVLVELRNFLKNKR